MFSSSKGIQMSHTKFISPQSDEDKPGTSSKKKSPAAVSKTPNAWKSECLNLLETVFQCEDSNPFRFPVNPDEFPVSLEMLDWHSISSL
jgi:hypothetical protein